MCFMKLSLSFMLVLSGFASLAFQGSSTQKKSEPQAQVSNAPGTIRVQVRLVPVDVIVTDDHDRPVTDLKQEDFQILEDGKPQEIRHFSVQTLTAAAAEPIQPALPRAIPTLELAPQQARTFLILLGRGNHQLFGAVDALIRFVRSDLLPQDRVAVFAYNRATDFTTDHEQIAQVLERYKKYNTIQTAVVSRSRGLAAVYGTKTIPDSVQSEIDKVIGHPPELASRQLVPAANKLGEREVVPTGSDAENKAASEMEHFDLEALTGGIPLGEWIGLHNGSNQDARNIFTCIEYLRYLEGEKHLLFFTGQGLYFPYGRVDYDNAIAKAANDARVAIDVFQTEGLDQGQGKLVVVNVPPTFEKAGETGLVYQADTVTSIPAKDWAIQTIRNFAQLTGGRAAIYRDTGNALNQLNEATRTEYLLGYYPKDENWNGQYRHVNVKVNRPGLKVSFRHGYYARDTVELYDRKEFMAYTRISAAVAYQSDLMDIQFGVGLSQATDSGNQPQIKVDLQISPSGIRLNTIGERHTGKVRIAIYYANAKGLYLGEDWKTLDLSLKEDSYQRFLRSGMPVSTMIPLKEPKQNLLIILYDMEGDKLGSKRIKFQ